LGEKEPNKQTFKEALIKWDSQGPKALEQGSGRSPDVVNQCFLKLQLIHSIITTQRIEAIGLGKFQPSFILGDEVI
jgi:hypothetical protein